MKKAIPNAPNNLRTRALYLLIILLGSACSKADLYEVHRQDLILQDPETRIIEFLSMIQEDHLQKSSTCLEVEECLWLMESSLTYSLADPLRESADIFSGKSRLEISATGPSLPLQTVALMYQALSDTLFAVVSKNGLQDAFLEFVDLKWVTEDGQVFVTMDYAFGHGGIPSYLSSSFGPQDWWWYGMGMGRCNGMVCCQGKDATTEIMRKAMLNLSTPLGHAYYTDIEAVIVRNPNGPYSSSIDPNYCFYPIFYNTTHPPFDSTFHTCLSPQEMNFHYTQIQSLITQNRPLADPLDPSLGFKQPVGIALLPSEYYDAHGYYVVEHILFMFYGISHTSATWTPYAW
ncbi:MAG TPA: hypothetical protein P5248_06950 [Bacteroidales bacterium]|nr:hypothetical protein [Bacteroidales bacterium]